MNPSTVRAAALLLLMLPLISCTRPAEEAPPLVAATNSLLEGIARDLLGEGPGILRLTEPGACPGRVDLRPSHVRQLFDTRVLLRMDFQQSLDDRLGAQVAGGLRIAEIAPDGGLCEPRTYLDACHQVAAAFVEAGLLDDEDARRHLQRIAVRITQLSDELRAQVAALHGRAVLTSAHQAKFCRFLGLNVVGTFSSADLAGTGEMERAYRQGREAGVTLIIANLPEGRAAADALADRLGATVVVFGNFPEGDRFDDLPRANVRALLEALER